MDAPEHSPAVIIGVTASVTAIISTLVGWLLAIARGARTQGQDDGRLLARLDAISARLDAADARIAALAAEHARDRDAFWAKLNNGIAATLAHQGERIASLEATCAALHRKGE